MSQNLLENSFLNYQENIFREERGLQRDDGGGSPKWEEVKYLIYSHST